LGKSKEQSLPLNVNETKTISQQINITNPRLWSLDDPYLYRVIVEVKQNGKLIDNKIIRFGIPTIDIKTNGVFVKTESM